MMDSYELQRMLKPELIRTLVDRLTGFYLELNERLFSALKGRIDVYYFGDDFGSQNGLLFSREMWREFFFENYRRLIGLAHGHGPKADFGADLVFHGAIDTQGVLPKASEEQVADHAGELWFVRVRIP